MYTRYVTYVLIVVFVCVATFGLTALLAHGDHHHGCPLRGAQTVMCESTALEHVSLWQFLFTTILSLLSFALASAAIQYSLGSITGGCVRFRKHLIPLAPTILQRLLARGIIHPKVPALSILLNH